MTPGSSNNTLPYLIFGSILLYILYQIFFRRTHPNHAQVQAGYDDGNDDAPPPYPGPSKPVSYGTAAPQTQGGRGYNNFWTGLAAGGAATFALNALNNSRQQQQQQNARQVRGGRLDRDWSRGEGSSGSGASGSSGMRTSTG